KNIELGISRETSRKSKVLLIGAGEAGVLAAREINRRGDLELEIQGFVDDDPQKLGRSVLQGYKVLGTTRDLSRLVSELNTDYVVIAIAQASGKALRRIIQRCEDLPVKVRIIPGLYEILDGRVEISHLRKIQIEDLLGREKIELDEEAISCEMTGKTVMVTGAGGSIGAELARQVLRFSPSMLLLVERAEFALFEIDHELKELNRSTSIASLVGDVGDTARMRSILSQYKPQVIIHAAAHKHVPLMECNVTEAVKNNVLATRVLGELAGEAGADVFVLVSTDKAVRPTSVMGATKRFAEFVTQDLNRRFKTRFVAVRFGNVIGSTGSVIPIFLKQIHKGGPVTITDRRMKRYFMTIPEAAQLVLQASAIGRGGEVFILHMGEPLLITDLAETLISLSGFKPYEDIEIIETGLRPGEKLCEELRIEDEDRAATEHPKIFINDLGALDRETLDTALERVVQLVANRDEAGILMFLSELIPESRLNGASKKTIARASGM
ncbi:MAG TPA: nucleoside-diphosphate sugar epimerase/dehydratase, partial [Pyrinomonadaceae bacterium]|nr:nucleoside-diphosphate sugar epimerase/dehydratase [Pyrinomonadaceae bacterium]